jgi:hypothetical protein
MLFIANLLENGEANFQSASRDGIFHITLDALTIVMFKHHSLDRYANGFGNLRRITQLDQCGSRYR